MTVLKFGSALGLAGALAAGTVFAAIGDNADPTAQTAVAAPGAAEMLLDPRLLGSGVCRSDPKDRRAAYQRQRQLVAAATERFGAAEADAPPLWDNLGDLSWTITTDNDLAQAYFNQGLRLAYAFNHAEARRAFRMAQAADPECALCYWGEAFVLGPNINAPMDPADVRPAVAAAEEAARHAGRASAPEQALIAALGERYSAAPDADQAALNAAYAEAMTQVAAQYPDDTDIAVLFADSLMNLSPWDYWEADGQTPKGRTAEVVASLERALIENPDHPGAIHLYIHIVEASTTPERAEPHADRLAALMPGAGHLVHMPSHIYYRVGRFLDSLATNRAAAAADEAYLEQVDSAGGIYRYGYYPHNIHFWMTSAQMAGDGPAAIEAAEKLSGALSDEIVELVPWVQPIKQAPYFAHAQFSDAAAILALPDPGDRFPFVKAGWHYARGVAFAMRGDVVAAQAEADAIADIERTADLSYLMNGGVPALDVLGIARNVIDGRIGQAQGDFDRAIESFRTAAALQDGLPYMEPPFWYYPVRQSLGVTLLMAGRANEAEQVLRQSLVNTPNNAWALFALRHVYEAHGDDFAVGEMSRLFEAAWGGDDSGPDLLRI